MEERFFNYRAKHHLTQGELASLLGVRREVINRIENGKKPSKMILARFDFLEKKEHE